MIGQDAVNTANAFAEGVGFDGVVLTKLDGDARGGAALSIARVTGRPIMFASNGEALKDFDVFHPDRMASRILGMGDMLTLIEQAEKTFDAEQSAKAAAKLAVQGRREFGLADFLQQMQMVRKMGPLSKIFGMLPGMGEIKDQINNIDEKEVDRIEAIIHSMTPAERDNPKIIDGSRRARIARGAGVEVSDVNGLVNRFFEARKMMSSHGRGQDARHAGPARDARRHAAASRPSSRRRRAAAASPATRPSATPRSPSRPPSTRRRRSAASPTMDPAHCRRRWPSSSCRRSCAAASASRPTGRARDVLGAAGCTCSGVVLPEGEHRDLWVVDGLIRTEPVRGRRDGRHRRAGCMPGLVDAHCHVGLESHGAVPDDAGRGARAGRPGRRGAAAAGRRQPGRHPVDGRARRTCRGSSAPAGTSPGRSATCATTAPRSSRTTLVAEVERQAARGDGWVKLVGDWIDRDVGDLAPLWPVEAARGGDRPGPRARAAG